MQHSIWQYGGEIDLGSTPYSKHNVVKNWQTCSLGTSFLF